MSDDHHSRTVFMDRGSQFGIIWVIGWMFTIGFIKMIWWQALLALLIWPYYLGVAVR